MSKFYINVLMLIFQEYNNLSHLGGDFMESILTGNVKWYDIDRGYGFITGHDGEDYFAHISKVKTDGTKNLVEDEFVSFEIVQTRKGIAANNIIKNPNLSELRFNMLALFKEAIELKNKNKHVMALDFMNILAEKSYNDAKIWLTMHYLERNDCERAFDLIDSITNDDLEYYSRNDINELYLQLALKYWDIDTEEADVKSFTLLEKAASQNDDIAQNSMGFFYELGIGVPVDLNKAFEWYQKSAKQGYDKAILNVGRCYEEGIGTEANIFIALEWYHENNKTLEVNQILNEFSDEIYEAGLSFYDEKKYQEAYECFIEIAEMPNSNAQFYLGTIFHHGYHRDKDYKKAVIWYQKSANLGNRDAQFHLGWCYKDKLGTNGDLQYAKYWFEKAANQGHSLARQHLRELFPIYTVKGFNLYPNQYLKNSTKGYYHTEYLGMGVPGNPDFLVTFKNRFLDKTPTVLNLAKRKVIEILLEDIPQVMRENGIESCTIIAVPRSKRLDIFHPNQLCFRQAIAEASQKLTNVVNGIDLITRIQDTRTTHYKNINNQLWKSRVGEVENNGDLPYPGITKNTCILNREQIQNKTIILIDDIYTRTINIDEDCIQALYDYGAKKVIFYAIGYTV